METAMITDDRLGSVSTPCHANILRAIAHASHLLPAQGPITVFVHHNTLHAFEQHSFHDAVVAGARVFRCHPYLPEAQFHRAMSRGRIQPEDIAEELLLELGDHADELIGFLGTRYYLRHAMLQHQLRTGTSAELQWVIAETDALRTLQPETSVETRQMLIRETRRWVMRDLRDGNGDSRIDLELRNTLRDLLNGSNTGQLERWNEPQWEAYCVQALWFICRHGVSRVPAAHHDHHPDYVRHRDLLLELTGQDTDEWINAALIPLMAAFVDQGFSHWPLPERSAGLFRSFCDLHTIRPLIASQWQRGLAEEVRRLQRSGTTAMESIEESFEILGVLPYEYEDYTTQSLLALRGFAGMLWQLETRGDRVARPVPEQSLVEYLAVRLVLERLALRSLAEQELGYRGRLAELRRVLSGSLPPPHDQTESTSYLIFQLAQRLGWQPGTLASLPDTEWARLTAEVTTFSGVERRKIYHLAYERRYRHHVLDSLVAHQHRLLPPGDSHRTPSFQAICCIDEREESFRRHLEETEPSCETFGAAGFFSVPMYYQGASQAHFSPLCPVVIRPQHYVREEVALPLAELERRRRYQRRTLGTWTHRFHFFTRTLLGGWLAAILGSLASVPLVMRILFPRLTARLRRTFGQFVHTPPLTHLELQREADPPGPQPGHLGFRMDEMATFVARLMRDIGLTRDWAHLVFIIGHGSSSLNNPHKSAYDCGACGGGCGGPNARAIAQMANDPRVRALLADDGLRIPDTTTFIGAMHDTCDDSVTFYELERLSGSQRTEFEQARQAIEEARGRNAQERCRRFESAELNLSAEMALRHVEGRSEDLSQVRPELGHATNAVCLVGRRAWSRGLFLDRRAFLHSYDPQQDDDRNTILVRILQAVIPVCSGINLEYYFSHVDPTGYGCGTKLPHNITSLLGVMNGAASDLLPGLPWQMVEIHEPMRLLVVIESTPAALHRIMSDNPLIGTLCLGGWIQLATFDPQTRRVHLFRNGEFRIYHPDSQELATARTSRDWYRGWRDHLGCATIASAQFVPASRSIHSSHR